MQDWAERWSGRVLGRLLRKRAARLAVLACTVGTVAPVQAQEAAAPPGSFDNVLELLQLKAKVAPAPAFVTQSRPRTEPDFMPVSTPHPERDVKLKTPAEVAAATADLDAARTRQQQRAGQVPPAVPLKRQGAGKSAKDTVR